MAKRGQDTDADQDLDPAGLAAATLAIVVQRREPDGPLAEKGDQSRDKPLTAVRPGTARRGRAASTASAPAPRATPPRSTGDALSNQRASV